MLETIQSGHTKILQMNLSLFFKRNNCESIWSSAENFLSNFVGFHKVPDILLYKRLSLSLATSNLKEQAIGKILEGNANAAEKQLKACV